MYKLSCVCCVLFPQNVIFNVLYRENKTAVPVSNDFSGIVNGKY